MLEFAFYSKAVNKKSEALLWYTHFITVVLHGSSKTGWM